MSKTNQKYYIVRVILFEIKNYVHASFTTHPFTTQKASCSPTNYNIKTKQNTEKHLYIKKILHHSNVWKNVDITIWTCFQYRWLHLEWVLHQQWMDATNTYILSDRFTSQKLGVCVCTRFCVPWLKKETNTEQSLENLTPWNQDPTSSLLGNYSKVKRSRGQFLPQWIHALSPHESL